MDTPETDTGAAFAAGHATATAEAAASDAALAEIRADDAQEQAEHAAARASDAETAAWGARAAVDDLRAEMRGMLDEIRESMSTGRGDRDTAGTDSAGTAVPAPEPKDETPASSAEQTEDDKPKRRAYGSRTWFGD